MNDAERLHAPSRRGNGLRADDYVRVARPTPAIAAAALDALRRTGIAARLTDSDRAGREELWADARELDDVATVLAAVVRHAGAGTDDLGPVGDEPAPTDLADLVGPGGASDLGELLDLRDLRGPGTPADRADRALTGEPDDDPDDVAGRGTRNPTPSARPYPTPARPAASARRRRRAEVPDDDDPDDHFRPDDPESLRTLSRTTVWALAILAVGVVALALSGLAPNLVGAYAPLASLLGTAAVLVGVGMLVTRLRDGHHGEDDDRGGPNGDGAIL